MCKPERLLERNFGSSLLSMVVVVVDIWFFILSISPDMPSFYWIVYTHQSTNGFPPPNNWNNRMLPHHVHRVVNTATQRAPRFPK